MSCILPGKSLLKWCWRAKQDHQGAKVPGKLLAMSANLLLAFYITVVTVKVVILIPTEDLVAQLY